MRSIVFYLDVQVSDYGSDSYAVDFAANGQLITNCLDGYLRLYDRDYQLLAKKKAAGGNQPFQVVFSPNGHWIAVGFYDAQISMCCPHRIYH